MFGLVLVELGDRRNVQKLVEESATVPPLVAVFH